MKKRYSISCLILLTILVLGSCKKDEVKAVLHPGTSNTLTASSENIILDSTDAENTEAVVFHWTPVDFGEKVAATYTLQLDTLKDSSFEEAINVPLADKLSLKYTMDELNQMVLKLGMPADSVSTLRARVKVEVPGMNSAPQQVASVFSNVLTLSVTPYSTKPQPKYEVPNNLYIVGDATPGGWDNPVAVPSQQFTQIDEATFGIILPLTGGKEYLLLPKNGDWGHKYAVTDNTAPDVKTGTDFVPDADDNIKGPDATGLYKIIVDFISGTYTVTPVDPASIPDKLFIVGDATPGGWDNPVAVPDQEFTKTSVYTFSLTLHLTAGKEYLFIPDNGSWDHKFAVADNTVGDLGLGSDFVTDTGDNIPSPQESGTYRIEVNFLTDRYTLTKL